MWASGWGCWHRGQSGPVPSRDPSRPCVLGTLHSSRAHTLSHTHPHTFTQSHTPHTFTHSLIHTHTHSHIHTHLTHTFAHTFTHSHSYTLTHSHTFTHTCTHSHSHSHHYTCIHTYTHIFRHTHHHHAHIHTHLTHTFHLYTHFHILTHQHAYSHIPSKTASHIFTHTSHTLIHVLTLLHSHRPSCSHLCTHTQTYTYTHVTHSQAPTPTRKPHPAGGSLCFLGGWKQSQVPSKLQALGPGWRVHAHGNVRREQARVIRGLAGAILVASFPAPWEATGHCSLPHPGASKGACREFSTGFLRRGLESREAFTSRCVLLFSDVLISVTRVIHPCPVTRRRPCWTWGRGPMPKMSARRARWSCSRGTLQLGPAVPGRSRPSAAGLEMPAQPAVRTEGLTAPLLRDKHE